MNYKEHNLVKMRVDCWYWWN